MYSHRKIKNDNVSSILNGSYPHAIATMRFSGLTLPTVLFSWHSDIHHDWRPATLHAILWNRLKQDYFRDRSVHMPHKCRSFLELEFQLPQHCDRHSFAHLQCGIAISTESAFMSVSVAVEQSLKNGLKSLGGY